MNPHEALPSPVLHTVTARDGWLLRVWDYAPALDRPRRGVIVAGHAMMTDSRSLCRPDRPTIAAVLVAAGFRVLVPDLRGHGESGPRPADGGDWSFDDLVGDVSHYVELARALEPERPIALLGHCLSAQVALAWLGQHPRSSVSAMVLLGCVVWNRRFETSRWRMFLARAMVLLGRLAIFVLGYIPARRLRIGASDVARSYWRQLGRHMRDDTWDSNDGSVDYHAALASIDAPVLHVMSEGDRALARPPACVRVTATIESRELLVLGRDDAPGSLADSSPGHMGMVTDPRTKLAWHWIAGWLERSLGG